MKTVVKVVKSGVRFNAWDSKGNKYTGQITTGARKKAYANGNALEQRVNKSGKTYWWPVPMSVYEATENSSTMDTLTTGEVKYLRVMAVVDFIQESYGLKPKGLVMNSLKWKYLVRSAVRGKNIMMTGSQGVVKLQRSP